MLIIDMVGYVAAGLVLTAFCMRSMCTLRVLAILSNLAFITYAYHRDLPPVLLLHVVLLPVNAGRLYQLWTLDSAEL
jgi:CRP/FNR family transcriptional regulator, cyclic AMP receptor protein